MRRNSTRQRRRTACKASSVVQPTLFKRYRANAPADRLEIGQFLTKKSWVLFEIIGFFDCHDFDLAREKKLLINSFHFGQNWSKLLRA